MVEPEVIGHRGARCYAPENTLPSYKVALDTGISWIDFDVVVTKDKYFITYHDLIINPDILCDKNNNYLADSMAELLTKYPQIIPDHLLIKNLNLSSLAAYQVKLNQHSAYSKWFSHQQNYANNHIPSLLEAINYIDSISDQQICFQIEVKNDFRHPNWSYSYQEVAQLLHQFILTHNLTRRVKIQAFDWRILINLNRLLPELKTAYLIGEDFYSSWQTWYKDHELHDLIKQFAIEQNHLQVLSLIKHVGGYSFEPEDVMLTHEELSKAHELGLKVYVWSWAEHSGEVFNPYLIQKLIMWGVDGIITDDPARLKEMLKILGK